MEREISLGINVHKKFLNADREREGGNTFPLYFRGHVYLIIRRKTVKDHFLCVKTKYAKICSIRMGIIYPNINCSISGFYEVVILKM